MKVTTSLKLSLTISLVFLVSHSVEAARKAPRNTHAVPCAILEEYKGEVQILDATRSHVHASKEKLGIP